MDTVPTQESAVAITGLRPGSFYVVRVALVNNLEFVSKSQPVRFRTRSPASGESFALSLDGHEPDGDGVNDAVPRVRPYRGLKHATPAAPLSPTTISEVSLGSTSRNTITGKRSTSTLRQNGAQTPTAHSSEPLEGIQAIQRLTEKLDAIRRETEDAEKQAKEEEEEETRQKDEFAKMRDELKMAVMDKERASKDLKRNVNTLERQNTAAQNERTKQERLLQNKRHEIQKLKNDSTRWDEETGEMTEDVGQIRKETAEFVESTRIEHEALCARLADEISKSKVVDEEIRQKTSEVKHLTRILKNASPLRTTDEPDTNVAQEYQRDIDDERAWQLRKQGLHHQHSMAWSKLESAKRFHSEQLRYLDSLRGERRRQEDFQKFTATPQRFTSQNVRQALGIPTIGSHSHQTSTGPSPAPFVPGMAAGIGIGQAPFLNISSGMTITGTSEDIATSENEKVRSADGALVSPGVETELLPAGLFSVDEGVKNPAHVQPLPGLGSLPGPGTAPSAVHTNGATSHEYAAHGPASPGSASSRSPSVFASPHISQQNLYIGARESGIDGDGRSIRSTRSHRAASGSTGSRFSGMFGIKQRSKTVTDELLGAPLGKASSMPRQYPGETITGLATANRKRNSSLSSNAWNSRADAYGTSARKGFALFSKVPGEGWPASFTNFGRKPATPRPTSTHSNELPRPSSDSSRWGVEAFGDANSGARSSPLAFGPGWTASAPRLHSSRHSSRQTSVHYRPRSPPEDIVEDDNSDPEHEPEHAARMPPVGTSRPKTGDGAAKLNPNAKDFKSFLSSMKLSGKSKEASGLNNERTTSNARPTPVTTTTPAVGASGAEGEESASPVSRRKSRDARSNTATDSSVAESGRHSADLALIPSQSPNSTSDLAPSPSLAGNSMGNFMQKITRKGSSSKFSIPSFSRQKSRLDPSSTPVAPAEDEGDKENAGSQLTPGSTKTEHNNRDTKDGAGNRSSRSWNNVLKLGRKDKERKGNESASLSGMSMDWDEEDESESPAR